MRRARPAHDRGGPVARARARPPAASRGGRACRGGGSRPRGARARRRRPAAVPELRDGRVRRPRGRHAGAAADRGAHRSGPAGSAGARPGEAMQIATGGAVPAGADAVVPVEYVVVRGDTVDISASLRRWARACARAPATCARATRSCRAGIRLGRRRSAPSPPQAWPRCCARAGLAPPCSRRGPSSGSPARRWAGQIYESNSFLLLAAEARAPPSSAWARRRRRGSAPRRARARAGGGRARLLGRRLGRPARPRAAVGRELGVEEVFWRVAVKPGKPVAFGVRGGTLVFGLPGNPVSALVGFELFVRPALLALQGATRPAAALRARAPRGGGAPQPGRDELVRARSTDDGEGRAGAARGQESHMIVRAAAADVLALVPRGDGAFEAGAPVRFLRSRERVSLRRGVVARGAARPRTARRAPDGEDASDEPRDGSCAGAAPRRADTARSGPRSAASCAAAASQARKMRIDTSPRSRSRRGRDVPGRVQAEAVADRERGEQERARRSRREHRCPDPGPAAAAAAATARRGATAAGRAARTRSSPRRRARARRARAAPRCSRPAPPVARRTPRQQPLARDEPARRKRRRERDEPEDGPAPGGASGASGRGSPSGQPPRRRARRRRRRRRARTRAGCGSCAARARAGCGGAGSARRGRPRRRGTGASAAISTSWIAQPGTSPRAEVDVLRRSPGPSSRPSSSEATRACVERPSWSDPAPRAPSAVAEGRRRLGRRPSSA